jgi:hypothetical protein
MKILGFEKEHPRDKNNQKFVDKAKVDGTGSVAGGLNKSDKLKSKININKLSDEQKCKLAKETDNLNILEKLANDEWHVVRQNVAYNRKSTPEILDKLADDEEADIREAVAINHNTSPKTLKKLAKDKEEAVKYIVATNRNTPVETLDELASKYMHIPSTAQPELLGDPKNSTAKNIIDNPSTSVPTIIKMSEKGHPEIKQLTQELLESTNYSTTLWEWQKTQKNIQKNIRTIFEEHKMGDILNKRFGKAN